MPRYVSADRAGLLLKSAVAAVGLIALMGCTTADAGANAGANAGDQVSANSGGTQNAGLLMHMGVSDTSYSSRNGDHGGGNFHRHHHS
jgi:hypothetical protein